MKTIRSILKKINILEGTGHNKFYLFFYISKDQQKLLEGNVEITSPESIIDFSSILRLIPTKKNEEGEIPQQQPPQQGQQQPQQGQEPQENTPSLPKEIDILEKAWPDANNFVITIDTSLAKAKKEEDIIKGTVGFWMQVNDNHELNIMRIENGNKNPNDIQSFTSDITEINKKIGESMKEIVEYINDFKRQQNSR